MQRDLRRLADTRFDLVIVGGGFYGAVAAWDATLRGLSVALVDQHDFGAGTSFNNHKTLHGGLRSLQSMNFGQMRLFIRERRALARVAPHLVRPMPFVIPTYRHPVRSGALMRVALTINDTVARDRHDGLADPALHLPPSRVMSRADCLRLNPFVDPQGVTGGAMWHDYQMHNTDRMTFSFVLSAADRGAATANYAKAIGVLREGDRIAGVRIEDSFTSATIDVRAHTVLNAAGPWARTLLHSLEPRATMPAPRLSRAMNLVVRHRGATQGCGGLTRGRFLFMIPWRDVTLVGTSHDPYSGAPDELAVTRADLDAFLSDAREAFPGADLATDDVRLIHRGLLPTVSADHAPVKLLRESTVVDHRGDGAPGLISMFGVRYTTARHTAAQAIDAVFRDRGDATPPRGATDTTPVVGGDITNKDQFMAEALATHAQSATAETLRRLVMTYGTRYEEVLRLLLDEPDLGEPIGRASAVTGAEIVHATRRESAVRLSDALIRRTEAGSAGHPGMDAVARAAALMARERQWNEQQTADEVASVEAFYQLPQ